MSFNLSSKKVRRADGVEFPIYSETDVKEFIRLLKEEAKWNLSGIVGQSITSELHDIIDKLAGEELV